MPWPASLRDGTGGDPDSGPGLPAKRAAWGTVPQRPGSQVCASATGWGECVRTVEPSRGSKFSQQALVWQGFMAEGRKGEGWKHAEVYPVTLGGDLCEAPLWL